MSHPPLAVPCNSTNSSLADQPKRLRAAFYIDGFNFYHALDELKKNYLKWLDWRALAEMIVKKYNLEITEIVFCTASPKHKGNDVIQRHRTYVRALSSSGIIIKQGFFISERIECNKCGGWDKFTEKEGDVNLSVSLIEGALKDKFDVAFLVTSDSDQKPAIAHIARNYREKQVVASFPSWRETTASTKLANECSKTSPLINIRSQSINEIMVSKCLFPSKIETDINNITIPDKYYNPSDDY